MSAYIHGKSIIRIAAADDHVMLREAICSAINSWDNCKVIMQADDGKELIEKLQQKPEVDLLLLDIGMPLMDGFDVAKWVKENYPDIKVLAISMFNTELTISRIITAGANGFIPKSGSMSEIKKAIFETMKIGSYFSNDAAGLFAKRFFWANKKQGTIPLNETELLFLKLLCTEMTYKEIASKLKLNERQTDYMREMLFDRFEVHSRIGLAKYALNSGILS